MLNKSFWLSIAVFAVITLLLPGSGAIAQGKKKEPQTLSDQQLADSILTLRRARVTLENADHDYGGHRAAAVHDIHAATKQLRLALEHVKKGKVVPKDTKVKGTDPKEPQAISDQKLADSIPVLKQTQTLLEKANHDYGGHRAKAVTDLGAAIGQLEKALKFSKEKNQNK